MIKEIKMYTIICDGCGKDVNADSDFAAWTELEPSLDLANCDGWHIDDDNHYCSNCYEVDDNGFMIVKNKQI